MAAFAAVASDTTYGVSNVGAPLFNTATAGTDPGGLAGRSASHAETADSGSDTVTFSAATRLLNQVDAQIQSATPNGYSQILSAAASNILAEASSESDPDRASALLNLAGRLQVAAGTSGLSAMAPYSLVSLLGV